MVLLGLSIFQKFLDAKDLHVLIDFYHDEGLKHHIFNFDKHLISLQTIFSILGFQRLMDSSALGISAETKDDALTENEYMPKKLRIDASKVTNPWSMGIFSSKYMCLGV